MIGASLRVLATVAALAIPVIGATVHGTVKDSSGTAVGGVVVTVSALGGGGGGGAALRDTTDAAGIYSIANVNNGFYQIQAAKTGYTTFQEFLQVQANDVVHDITMVALGTGGTITGTVTDSVAGTVLAGAKVRLQEPGMGSTVTTDSATTGADGKYTFSKVQQGFYMVQAIATGYSTRSTQVNFSGTGTTTLNFKMIAVQVGRIIGKITADSLPGTVVSGAKVVLVDRNTQARVDSAITPVAGTYAFAAVVAGRYMVEASKTGYTGATATTTITATETDTVNIAIDKLVTGTLLVFVASRTDSAKGLAGASVTLRDLTSFNGDPVLGVTGSTGYVTFADLAAGNNTAYSVSVSLTGFAARTVSNLTVPGNGRDTVNVFLSVDTTAKKRVVGIVRDSITNAVLSNVAVVLTIRTGGGGGTTVTLFDSTDATGAYLITGVPLAAINGSLSASRTGYVDYNRFNLNLGEANVLDTIDFNFKMLKPTVGVQGAASIVTHGTSVGIVGPQLCVRNILAGSVVSVFDLNGRLLHRATAAMTMSAMLLPRSVGVSGRSLVVSVTSGDKVMRTTVTQP